jgi:hypothetical protein
VLQRIDGRLFGDRDVFANYEPLTGIQNDVLIHHAVLAYSQVLDGVELTAAMNTRVGADSGAQLPIQT